MTAQVYLLLELCFAITFVIIHAGSVAGVQPIAEWESQENPKVTVYSDENFQGNNMTFLLPEFVCVDIPDPLEGHISSIKLRGRTCAVAFSKPGCPIFYDYLQLDQFSYGNQDLGSVDWNDRIVSISRC